MQATSRVHKPQLRRGDRLARRPPSRRCAARACVPLLCRLTCLVFHGRLPLCYDTVTPRVACSQPLSFGMPSDDMDVSDSSREATGRICLFSHVGGAGGMAFTNKHLDLSRAACRGSWTPSGHCDDQRLGLYIELLVVRWHATCFPRLPRSSKTSSLLSCFLGLGIGFGLSAKRPAARWPRFCRCWRYSASVLLFGLLLDHQPGRPAHQSGGGAAGHGNCRQ